MATKVARKQLLEIALRLKLPSRDRLWVLSKRVTEAKSFTGQTTSRVKKAQAKFLIWTVTNSLRINLKAIFRFKGWSLIPRDRIASSQKTRAPSQASSKTECSHSMGSKHRKKWSQMALFWIQSLKLTASLKTTRPAWVSTRFKESTRFRLTRVTRT